MLRRHADSAVLAGAFVFPGGKVDPDDQDEEILERMDCDPVALRDSLANHEMDASQAAGHFVAACRETFEECGVLLARGADANVAAQAHRLAREGLSFVEVLQRLELELEISRLTPWSRWITPKLATLSNRRFDTYFFVARVPSEQHARHDERETTEGVWERPRLTLERYWDREIELAAPQILTLAHFSRFSHADEIIAEARRRPPPTVEPSPRQIEGGRQISYPGDPLHPVSEPAMPGPTRLIYRNGRFEPEGGFEDFFR